MATALCCALLIKNFCISGKLSGNTGRVNKGETLRPPGLLPPVMRTLSNRRKITDEVGERDRWAQCRRDLDWLLGTGLMALHGMSSYLFKIYDGEESVMKTNNHGFEKNRRWSPGPLNTWSLMPLPAGY